MAQDQPPRINAHFNGETLGQVLQMLNRSYGLQYALARDVDPQTPVHLSLDDVSPQQLLSALLEANGLVAISRDGRYMIRQRPAARQTDGRGAEPMPRPVGVERPSPPTRPGIDARAQGTRADDAQGAEGEREEIWELIWPKYLSADVAAAIFGGTVIPAGGFYFGGYNRGGVQGGTGTGVRGYRSGTSRGIGDDTTGSYRRGAGTGGGSSSGRISSFGDDMR
ncbi:MAG: hypothetical protein U9R79_12640 [Armatimonadota bacterium]|nr:hypothetical protein [Armatimonadota bacterium]